MTHRSPLDGAPTSSRPAGTVRDTMSPVPPVAGAWLSRLDEVRRGRCPDPQVGGGPEGRAGFRSVDPWPSLIPVVGPRSARTGVPPPRYPHRIPAGFRPTGSVAPPVGPGPRRTAPERYDRRRRGFGVSDVPGDHPEIRTTRAASGRWPYPMGPAATRSGSGAGGHIRGVIRRGWDGCARLPSPITLHHGRVAPSPWDPRCGAGHRTFCLAPARAPDRFVRRWGSAGVEGPRERFGYLDEDPLRAPYQNALVSRETYLSRTGVLSSPFVPSVVSAVRRLVA